MASLSVGWSKTQQIRRVRQQIGGWLVAWALLVDGHSFLKLRATTHGTGNLLSTAGLTACVTLTDETDLFTIR